MSIDRVSTAGQSQFLLAQIQTAAQQLDTTQAQVASGKVSNNYTGLGDKVAVLEAARTAANKADAYQASTTMAVNQADLQDSQLSSLSDLANQLRQAITTSVANNDGTTLMASAQGIFDQVSQILNTKDANGNYLYGGDKDNTPPFNVSSLSQLAALPSVASAFSNGTLKKSVMVGDGQSVQVGVLASDIERPDADAEGPGGFRRLPERQFCRHRQSLPAHDKFPRRRNPDFGRCRLRRQLGRRRQRLRLQPAQGRRRPPDVALDALQGLRLEPGRRRHADGDQPAQPEPGRAAGRPAGHLAIEQGFAAELPAGAVNLAAASPRDYSPAHEPRPAQGRPCRRRDVRRRGLVCRRGTRQPRGLRGRGRDSAALQRVRRKAQRRLLCRAGHPRRAPRRRGAGHRALRAGLRTEVPRACDRRFRRVLCKGRDADPLRAL